MYLAGLYFYYFKRRHSTVQTKTNRRRKNPVKIVQTKTLELTVKTESDIYLDVSKYCCARDVYWAL